MESEHAGVDAPIGHDLGEELLCEARALALCEEPADGHATEQIEDGVQAVEDALRRAAKLAGISQVHTWLGAVAVSVGFA